MNYDNDDLDDFPIYELFKKKKENQKLKSKIIDISNNNIENKNNKIDKDTNRKEENNKIWKKYIWVLLFIFCIVGIILIVFLI